MTTKLLAFALLFGAAGGVLATVAVRAVRAPDTHDRVAGAAAPVARAEEPAESQEPLVTATPPGAEPTLVGSPDARAPAPAGAGLEERLAALEGQVQALTDQVAELARYSSLVELKSLSDEKLHERAKSLWTFKNYAGALQAYEALLAREPDLDVETRGEVLLAMSQCCRALGQQDKADAILQQAEELHGEGTAGAMTAHYQRAWVRFAKGDMEGARAFMQEVARSESSPTFWRLFSRANAADFSIRMGDTTGVRQDLEDFKRELEGDDSDTANRVRDYVDRLLEQLDA